MLGFRHRGLARLYTRGDRSRVAPGHVNKIERILGRLDISEQPNDLDLLGYRLRPLIGELTGFRPISVSDNWRIIFRFDGKNASDVDFVDYH